MELIKNPVIAEFLGISRDTSYLESDLEQFIINNLQKFIMELGKGYAFVGRQQHIKTEKEDYFIDLVFYNYILKCFVLFDLKQEKASEKENFNESSKKNTQTGIIFNLYLKIMPISGIIHLVRRRLSDTEKYFQHINRAG